MGFRPSQRYGQPTVQLERQDFTKQDEESNWFDVRKHNESITVLHFEALEY
jgi:hypothetical protein